MQRHKELYKEQSLVLSPRNHIQTNRERQQERRAKNREDCFQNNRIISISPTPVKVKPQPPPPTQETPKENEAPSEQQQNSVQEPPKSKTPRHQKFLKRYLQWNAAKKEEHKRQELLRRGLPVKPVAGTTEKAALPTSSVFRAPENLKNLQQKKEDNVAVFNSTKRQSLYVVVNPKVIRQTQAAGEPPTSRPRFQTVVNARVPSKPAAAAPSVAKPTPARKSHVPPSARPAAPAAPVSSKKVPSALPAAPAAPVSSKKVPSALPADRPMTSVRPKAAVRPPTVKTKGVGPAPTQPRTQVTSVRPKVPSTTASAPKMPPPPNGLKTRVLPAVTPRAAAQPRPKLTNVMTQPFEIQAVRKAPAGGRANIVKPQPIRGGAAGKFKAAGMANKEAGLAGVRKKPTNAKGKYTRLEEKARKLPHIKADLVAATTLELVPHTPLEEEQADNPFLAQSTSTQYKSNNCSNSLLEAFGDITALSPVASGQKAGSSTAKRQLLPSKNAQKPVPASKKKFNFTRYSVANATADESLALEQLQSTGEHVDISFLAVISNSRSVVDDAADATLVQGAEKTRTHSLPANGESTLVQEAEKTPPRRDSEGKPNYLSPFVSVSRGKVNSRSEREKRNSFYLQNEETSAEVRRAIESVLYFRLQLDEEIARLEALCSEWEAYSKENEERLLETGGGDMINVTVGQTRLLTTKKMMQFKGLIDRCEAGAKCKNQIPNDGSEETKPVQPEDLEGWWDMLRLQSENVDKRFANLERWKANDWLDPDAVAEVEQKQEQTGAKPKPKVIRKVKMKAKASSSLQQFLRKAHANMKKTKVEEAPMDNGFPPTPSRRSSQRVIVVRDRKSFSPARTVLRMSIGEGRASIAPNALLKTALIAAAEQNALKTPPKKSRQSILKTPGTAKRPNRGVIFSAKKSVRRFQFTIEEGNISTEEKVGADKLEDCEEDMSLEASTERRSLDQDATVAANGFNGTHGETPRAYALRNRKIVLRPSSEFM